MDFERFRTVNEMRGTRWHRGDLRSWSISDWGCAMGGEAGEALNAIKKLRRIEDEIPNISDPSRQLSTRGAAIDAIGEEIADTVIYADLLCSRIGLRLEDVIRKKFNETSVKYELPERL